jgi:hypothetical protein
MLVWLTFSDTPITKGLVVCHNDKIPRDTEGYVSNAFAHLRLGTQSSNVQESWDVGAWSARRKHPKDAPHNVSHRQGKRRREETVEALWDVEHGMDPNDLDTQEDVLWNIEHGIDDEDLDTPEDALLNNGHGIDSEDLDTLEDSLWDMENDGN